MLVFELWKKILIFTISFLALFFCLPNGKLGVIDTVIGSNVDTLFSKIKYYEN